MMTLVDIKEQLESIDQQIINLLEERVHVCAGQSIDSDEEAEMLSLWIEESAEKGLDDAKTEKIGKLAIAMCREIAE